MERVLVVAAHPDDEVLGCGGTLARHAANGDRVEALILADGETARANADAALRQAQAQGAARALGLARSTVVGLPDNRLDTMALLDIVKHVEAAIAELRPTIVYTHHAGDLTIDHRLAHRATLTACRPQLGAGVAAVYVFETPSSTEWAFGSEAPFVPQRFVDIAATIDAKRRALACYAGEMRDPPHPRSHAGVEALALLRGHQAGMAHAEAFMVAMEIVR
jgi:LmbE family N-acetylglucosaminyl deacetylase